MPSLLLCSSLMIIYTISASHAQLQTNFYSSSCPKVETIVRSTVQKYFDKDFTIAPGLLRLHFHDCFVQGCDASILISGPSSEKTALPNTGLRGFEVIDDAKSQLETACPGIVSCADILALAARDSVDLTNGPSWSVPLGRRDGRVSSASDANDLPAPFDSVAVQRQKFSAKGLNDKDLVTLVGAHTIGQTDCQFFSYRLYNFTTSGNADPAISQSFLTQLQTLCPSKGDPSKRVALDTGSVKEFDENWFKNVRDGQGILESDQRLWEDASTQTVIKNYAGTLRGLLGLRFDYEFSKAMVKMGSIGVKTESLGEIRKICSKFN